MPRRTRVAPEVLAALAPRRVAAVADLVAAGLSPATIAQRIRDGRWQRLARGVALLQSGAPSRDQEVEGALRYAGPGAVVTGTEAVVRHGLRRVTARREVEMLVDEDRQRTSGGLALIERTERLPAPVVRDGVPLAPLDRAIIDATRRMTDLDAVRALIAEAVQRRLTTVKRLNHELVAGCQRGTALPRQALADVNDGIRSASEGWMKDLQAGSTLPPALWNPRLYLPSGRFLASPDGWFDDVGLAWESDSVEFHPEGDDDTARRRADMIGVGVLVVHHRPRRFRTDRRRVVEEVWHYYRLAASRPRPDVRVTPAPRAA